MDPLNDIKKYLKVKKNSTGKVWLEILYPVYL